MSLRFSIITPSFNQGKFIERTICSVLDQDYDNVEHIIIDGGSTDETLDILKKYQDKIYYWVSEKDRGQSHAINKGFAIATGDIITWLNTDDWFEPRIFNEIATEFANGKIQVLVGNCMVWYSQSPEKNTLLKPGNYNFRLMLQYWKNNFIPPQPSVFFARKLLLEAGTLNENLNYAMDMDLWLRLSKKTVFVYIDRLFSNYLVHGASKTGSGFDNFVPEWKFVSRQYLGKAPTIEKILFYKEYYRYLLRYALNAIQRRVRNLK